MLIKYSITNQIRLAFKVIWNESVFSGNCRYFTRNLVGFTSSGEVPNHISTYPQHTCRCGSYLRLASFVLAIRAVRWRPFKCWTEGGRCMLFLTRGMCFPMNNVEVNCGLPYFNMFVSINNAKQNALHVITTHPRRICTRRARARVWHLEMAWSWWCSRHV